MIFAHLLEGHDSSGEHVLVPHREGLNERRAGWDLTISPHKSVSLAALVGGDKRLLEAHDRAVDKALSELERRAQAWVHGGRHVETTGVVVAASFRHETSRALDAELHSQSGAAATAIHITSSALDYSVIVLSDRQGPPSPAS